jgi:hypothetical protein
LKSTLLLHFRTMMSRMMYHMSSIAESFSK